MIELPEQTIHTWPLGAGSQSWPLAASVIEQHPRDPAEVGYTLVTEKNIDVFGSALRDATRVAIDTETPIHGPKKGQMRVLSAATRCAKGIERAWVFDARDTDPALLAPQLVGIEACAWNANFDARVLDQAVWGTSDTTTAMRWWDAQLADALLYQGQHGFSWFHGLAWATKHYLGIEAYGKGDVQISFDAESELTETQRIYAACDAVETLWVSDVIRERIEKAALLEISEIEQSARPFLDQMSRNGFQLDRQGWREFLVEFEQSHKDTLSELALLTGGGQANLFSTNLEPQWNPASEVQIKKALNTYSSEAVRVYNKTRFGSERLFGNTDRIGSTELAQIRTPLAEQILKYRAEANVLRSYGESLIQFCDDAGRLHPQYLQIIGADNGAVSTYRPNIARLPKEIAAYITPASGKVFIHTSLREAHLVYLAAIAQDSALSDILEQQDTQQVQAASTIFGRSSELILRDMPDLFGVGHWAQSADVQMTKVAAAIEMVDWNKSLGLATIFETVNSMSRRLRRSMRRWPNANELFAALEDTGEDISLEAVTSALNYSGAVAVLSSGLPFIFSTTTRSGRRIQFNLRVDSVCKELVSRLANPSSDRLKALSKLSGLGPDVLSRSSNETTTSIGIVSRLASMGDNEILFPELFLVAKSHIHGMTNAWRNAVIEGGVADIFLRAFGEFDRQLREHVGADAVLFVEDSLVIECERSDAKKVADLAHEVLLGSFLAICPDARPWIDVDIRENLSNSSIIETFK